MTLRCVIVDDNPAVLRAASELLEGQGIHVVGVASTSEEALALVQGHRPDVILIDIDLGPESGFELARRLAQSVEMTAAVLISTHDETDYAHLIATSPAIGFLSKSDLSATAIHRLLALARDEGRY